MIDWIQLPMKLKILVNLQKAMTRIAAVVQFNLETWCMWHTQEDFEELDANESMFSLCSPETINSLTLVNILRLSCIVIPLKWRLGINLIQNFTKLTWINKLIQKWQQRQNVIIIISTCNFLKWNQFSQESTTIT